VTCLFDMSLICSARQQFMTCLFVTSKIYDVFVRHIKKLVTCKTDKSLIFVGGVLRGTFHLSRASNSLTSLSLTAGHHHCLRSPATITPCGMSSLSRLVLEKNCMVVLQSPGVYLCFFFFFFFERERDLDVYCQTM